MPNGKPGTVFGICTTITGCVNPAEIVQELIVFEKLALKVKSRSWTYGVHGTFIKKKFVVPMKELFAIFTLSCTGKTMAFALNVGLLEANTG